MTPLETRLENILLTSRYSDASESVSNGVNPVRQSQNTVSDYHGRTHEYLTV